jgi:hypothetical protein
MYRFSDWITSLRPDFWKVFYEHPELLSVFSYSNGVLAAKNGGYQALESYDIVDIGEHNPGNTVAWVPIDLLANTYVAGSDYPYQFEVDAEWLYIDCLHDAHVDPTITLQNIVDFRLMNHKLCFIKYPQLESMYVSKGLYSGTRLADDFGTAFGYERTDSFSYRDSMVPLMELFYRGPTLHNIVSAANVMVNNPVAKYGNEVILNTAGGDVITDQYRYNLGGANLAYNVGDTIEKHSPFANAIELYTEKTNPSWWLDRIPGLFQKYKVDGAVQPSHRDVMMETFLKYFIAHIRINLNKTDWRQYTFYQDIWELLLDGSSTRTDYILSMFYNAQDFDMPEVIDVCKIRLTAFSIWGGRKVPGSEHWLYAPELVNPIVYPEGTSDYDWFVGSLRYHVLDEGTKTQEFWSSEPKQLSYVEPHISHWYGRNTMTPNIPLVSKRVSDSSIPQVQHLFSKVTLKRPVNSEVITVIPQDTNLSAYRMESVYGDQNIAHEDLDEWTNTGTTHLGIEGLVVNLGTTGTSVSPPINVGGIPKKLSVRVVKAVTSTTSVLVQYSNDNKATWIDVPSTPIQGLVGDIYFKATLQATSITSPVFKGLDISIRV